MSSNGSADASHLGELRVAWAREQRIEQFRQPRGTAAPTPARRGRGLPPGCRSPRAGRRAAPERRARGAAHLGAGGELGQPIDGSEAVEQRALLEVGRPRRGQRRPSRRLAGFLAAIGDGAGRGIGRGRALRHGCERRRAHRQPRAERPPSAAPGAQFVESAPAARRGSLPSRHARARPRDARRSRRGPRRIPAGGQRHAGRPQRGRPGPRPPHGRARRPHGRARSPHGRARSTAWTGSATAWTGSNTGLSWPPTHRRPTAHGDPGPAHRHARRDPAHRPVVRARWPGHGRRGGRPAVTGW